MADNVTLNAGAGGITLATDDIGGTHYQIVKISYGALDSATLVDGSNPLPVTGTLSVNTHAVTQSGTWTVQPGNTANTTAWLVTGTGGTFPATDSGGSLTVDAPVATPVFVRLSDGAAAISALPITDNAGSLTVDGTVSITANSAVNVAQVGGTNADTNSGLKSAGTLRVVLATDQPALTNKLLVTPDSVALPANQSVNVSQLAGTTTDTNSGNKSAGTLRVVLATDQPALTNKLLVTPDANSAVNVAQMNGVAVTMGNGVAGTGVQRVAIASDNTAFSVNATLKPATTGGFTTATGSIAATKTDIKGSAGQVYGWYIYNPNASVAYVQFFNAAAASVTLGTTAPVYSLGIPAGSAANVLGETGIPHSTAISIAVTTTRAGSTGPGSTVDYNIFYN